MNARYRGAYPSSGGVPGVRVSGTLPQRGSLCSPGTSSGFWRESEWKQPPLHPEEDVANLRAVNTVVLVLPPRPRFYVWISRTRDENDDEEKRMDTPSSAGRRTSTPGRGVLPGISAEGAISKNPSDEGERIGDDRNIGAAGELIWVGSLNAAIFHGEWLVS